MCLITEQLTPFTAERDITVYKVLHVVPVLNVSGKGDKGLTLEAPFQKNFEYEMGGTYEVGELEFAQTQYRRDFVHEYRRVVTHGLHSYCDQAAAIHLMYCLLALALCGEQYCVIECTVPKGTEYYSGLSSHEICSRKLRLERLVKLETAKSLSPMA